MIYKPSTDNPTESGSDEEGCKNDGEDDWDRIDAVSFE